MIRRIIIACSGLALLLTGAVSCVKKDPIMRISQVMLAPLSPDALPVDFRLNNQVVATGVSYPSAAGTNTYTIPYFTIAPGSTTIKFNLTGQAGTSYASGTKELQEDVAYSAFLIDSANKSKLAFVTDDVEEPTPGKVKLRFFHFSPNAPAMDVTVGAAGAKLFANRTFNDQETNNSLQSYIEVDPGVYAFAFKQAGTNTVLYTTINLSLLPDRIYTLAARGFVGGSSNRALGGWFFANKAN